MSCPDEYWTRALRAIHREDTAHIDPLAPARGVLIACVISLTMYAVIAWLAFG